MSLEERRGAEKKVLSQLAYDYILRMQRKRRLVSPQSLFWLTIAMIIITFLGLRQLRE